MGRGIAQGAAAVPVGRGVWGRRQMDQQHLEDPPLDVLQQRVRDRQLPHTAGGLGELPADVMAVQCIADGIQRPGGDPQIPHKGGELPIDNQVLSSLLMPAERYKFVWGTARRYLPAHRRCAPIPQAGSPARSAYARIQPTGRDSRPAPERGCSYHPCQQAWCELYQNYSRSPAAVKRRTAATAHSGRPRRRRAGQQLHLHRLGHRLFDLRLEHSIRLHLYGQSVPFQLHR